MISFTSRIDLDEVHVEDGGQAKWTQLDDGKEMGVFVRLHSWGDHRHFDSLVGRTVRVTIEVVDD